MLIFEGVATEKELVGRWTVLLGWRVFRCELLVLETVHVGLLNSPVFLIENLPPKKIDGWFTYKSPIKGKENDLNQTSRELCSSR